MNRRPISALLWVCVLLSGAAGLVYEVLWARYLAILFGNTTHAYTVVLATFMGGLALGAFSLGRLADRMREKLLLYALAEIGIALFCVWTPRLVAFSRTLYLAAVRTWPPQSWQLTALLCAIGAAIMLPPTILMGGTIPVLSAALTSSFSARGRTVARLYYLNSFGAVLGTLACGYYLVHRLGLGFTLLAAAAVNLAVGGAVLGIRLVSGRRTAPLPGEGAAAGAAPRPYPPLLAAIALAALFVSGAAAMLYELVWIRLLSLVLGSSTYSFSAVLATFISGITIGAFIVSRRPPRENAAFRALGLCEACAGLLLILSIPFYERLPYLFMRLSDLLSKSPASFPLYEGLKLLVSFLVILPPTVFLGMTLPLAGIVVPHGQARLGRGVGGVFAANTAGNIAGALGTGLALIPALGLKTTMELGIAANLGLGILIVAVDRVPSAARKTAFCLLLVAAFAGYRALVPAWNNAHFTLQVFRPEDTPVYPSPSAIEAGRNLLYYRDGANATVAVIDGGDEYRALLVNGKVNASTGGDMSTQLLLAHLPLTLLPCAEDVLVIGLGAGVTAGAAARHPIKTLDVVELSAEVAEASAFFSEVNDRVLEEPRLRLFLEDARTYVQRTGAAYDLIISEPSNPWMSGVGDLFSAEHFRDCLGILKERGVMAQWVQTYELDDDTFKIVVKTFLSVFPHASLWEIDGNNTLLIGSRGRLEPDLEASARRLASPRLQEQLQPIGLKDLFTLLCLQIASDAGLRGSVRSEPVVQSVYSPLLEYRAPRALYTGSYVRTYLQHLDERPYAAAKHDLLLKPYLETGPVPADALRNLLGFLKKAKGGYFAYLSLPVLDTLRREAPGDRELFLSWLASDLAPLHARLCEIEERIRGGDRDIRTLEVAAGLLLKRYLMLRSFLAPRLAAETLERMARCAELAGRDAARIYRLMSKLSLHERDYGGSFAYRRKAEALSEAENGNAVRRQTKRDPRR